MNLCVFGGKTDVVVRLPRIFDGGYTVPQIPVPQIPDKSAKCNAFASGNNKRVIGVLYSSDPAERAKLDEAEGVGSGYEHAMVTVINDQGRRQKILTYVATPDYIDDCLQPYRWYKDFVLAGSREHGLPQDYIAQYIESVEAIEDPNRARDKRTRSAALRSKGCDSRDAT